MKGNAKLDDREDTLDVVDSLLPIRERCRSGGELRLMWPGAMMGDCRGVCAGALVVGASCPVVIASELVGRASVLGSSEASPCELGKPVYGLIRRW